MASTGQHSRPLAGPDAQGRPAWPPSTRSAAGKLALSPVVTTDGCGCGISLRLRRHLAAHLQAPPLPLKRTSLSGSSGGASPPLATLPVGKLRDLKGAVVSKKPRSLSSCLC